MKKGRNHYHWAIAIIISLIQVIFIYSLFRGWGYDDAFITYRYAENIHEGLGFVYNPGQKVLGTTTPFFTLILAVFSARSIDVPSIATIVGTISLALGALFLWDLSYRWKRPITGWFSLILYPLFPLLLNTLGSETPLFLALCLGCYASFARFRFTFAASFLSLAILTRPEACLPAILLGVHIIVSKRHVPPLKTAVPILLILFPWILFSTFYFGSAIPVTLAAKQAQGSMSISQDFASGLIELFNRNYAGRGQYWFLIGLAIIGTISITFRNHRKWWLIVSWSLAHFLSLSLLQVTSYFWYYAPLVPSFLLLSGLGLESIGERLGRLTFAKAQSAISITLMAILSISIGQHAIERSRYPDPRLRIYEAVGEWVHANTEENQSVGTLEIGIIGYYAKRSMIDFSGVIDPSIAANLSANTTYADAASWAIRTYQPQVIILNSTWFPGLHEELVRSSCLPVKTFAGVEYGYQGDLLVLDCK